MGSTNDVAVVRRGSLLPALTAEQEERVVRPRADIYETPDHFLLLVNLPGAAKDAVSLRVDRDQLIVLAPADPGHRPGGRLLAGDLGSPVYHRSFTIGEGVDRDAIDARFDHGVLAVTLRKREDRKPRAITIR